MFYFGQKVRFINQDKHIKNPISYPMTGSIGTIIALNPSFAIVNWEIGTWAADYEDLEVAE